MPEADDLYDYNMGDLFVSETRQRPYRTGFHPRSWCEAYCIEDAMQLDDRQFKLWIVNRAGRSRYSHRDQRTEILALRREVVHLRRQVDELSGVARRRASSASKGLDVAAR